MPRLCLAATLLLGALLVPSRAVIISTGDGTGDTTAPTGAGNDFGFANVALVADTADGINIGGVYLGSGWVITAYHGVRDNSGGYLFGNVVLAGNSFSIDASSAVRLSSGAGTADLVIFHLFGPYPNLPSVGLSATTPATNSSLAMAGNGLNRATSQTQWTVNTATTPNTWTETTGPGDRQGYFYAAGATLRWGNNKRSNAAVATLDDGFGLTPVFQTVFSNDGTAVTNEAQAAPGDSGGGVFFKNGANWELSGIMLAAGGLNGQPANTAVFGDVTYIADIATFRTQIISIVPEPSVALLASGGILALVSQRRRPRRAGAVQGTT